MIAACAACAAGAASVWTAIGTGAVGIGGVFATVWALKRDPGAVEVRQAEPLLVLGPHVVAESSPAVEALVCCDRAGCGRVDTDPAVVAGRPAWLCAAHRPASLVVAS